MRVIVSIEIEGARGALAIADKMRGEAEHSGATVIGIEVVTPASRYKGSRQGDNQVLTSILAELKTQTKLFGTALEIEVPTEAPADGSAAQSWPTLPDIPQPRPEI